MNEVMTPAEVLAAAADKLDALASGATPELRLDDIESGLFPEDIAYIEAMCPLVGKALAEWLREQSKIEILDPEQWAAFDADTLDEPVRHVWGGDKHALALARLIIGGETE